MIRRMEVLAILAGVVLLLAVAGGLARSVAGTWRDGERRVKLEQTGPLVRGRAEVAGGHETYAGFVLFGRVALSRRAHGKALLGRLGFPESALAKLEGTETARLRLRLDGDRLVGWFIGKRFKLEGRPPVLVDALDEPPAERVWERART